jgi:hypothetical protein
MNDTVIKLLLDMGASGANVEDVRKKLEQLKPSLESAAAAGDKLEASSKKAAGGVAGMGQSLLQTGRVVQDFSQGGLGGILNNIEGLTMALGQGPGLAGVLTVAGVAFMLLKKPVSDLMESMGGGADAADHLADAVSKLTDANKKLKEQLGELAASSDANVKRLTEENQLLERQVKIREARANAMRREGDEATKMMANAAAMEGEPSLESKQRQPAEKARADQIKQLVGGDPEAKILKQRVALSVQNNPRFFTKNQESKDEERDRILAAFYAGHADALEYVLKELRAEGGAEGEGPLRSGLQQLAPGAQMGRRMRNVGQTLEGFGRKVMSKTAAEAQQRRGQREKEQQALGGQLTEQGESNELAGQQAAEREAAHDAAERKRESERQAKERERQQEKAHAKDMKAIGGTSIDERAALEAAQMRAMGGTEDRFGRFIPLTPNQQHRRLTGMVEQEIGRRFPGMPRDQRRSAAQGVSEQASSGVQDMLDKVHATMDSGLDATAATQQAMRSLLGALEAQAQRAHALEAQARAIGRQARGMEQSPMPSGLQR